MKKHHALVLSLLLGAASVAGVVALTRTVALGQASPTTPTSQLQQREASLDRARRDIARLDANVPPALPPATAPATAGAPRVVVVRATASSTAPQWDDDEGRGEEHEAQESEGHESEDGWDD